MMHGNTLGPQTELQREGKCSRLMIVSPSKILFPRQQRAGYA